LSATNLSVSEVAYAPDFEHSQSFSKLFKTKTNHSLLKFSDLLTNEQGLAGGDDGPAPAEDQSAVFSHPGF
jgi:hypothetical protein